MKTNPSSGNIYFASDAHLGSHYPDDPPAAEKKLLRWLDRIKEDAAAVYFLGDLFDYWFEYKYVVPKGHVRFLGKLAELVDRGIEIHLFAGNHDVWMFGYLSEEIGVFLHQGPLTVDLLGARFFLAHGDEVGKRPRSFRFIRYLFHSKICQVLYAGIHPRWTVGLARRWSLDSRKRGAAKHSEQQNRAADYLVDFAREYLLSHPDVHYFIFGHLHILLDLPLGQTSRLLVAGDWMDRFSYIRWDGDQLTLNRFEEN